ncbi:peptidoglycan DD-metalloendopeptidase family protein [Paenibacillus sp. GCM10027626]|uniref:peptidoglycan DD-metalloendopeptidase family protein n=1 Tax=Paenibacillus sp. GCM10027626 TaxID=3273411 RepID=UPI0036336383
MDKRNSNRDRRQERIKQIMQSKREEHYTEAAAFTDHSRHTGTKMFREADKHGEPDPELYWKKGPKPWEFPVAGSGAGPLTGLANKPGGDERYTPPLTTGKLVARGFYVQLVLSGIIFALIFGMFKLDVPLAKAGQKVVVSALTEQIDFSKAANWYAEKFSGSPSFIAGFSGDSSGRKDAAVTGEIGQTLLPPLAEGTVVRTFAETLSGVEIAAQTETAVNAAEMGRVILVTEDEKTGKTVVIQHVNQRVSIYGQLGAAQVAVNDWVEAGQKIGNLKVAGSDGHSLLFFAVKEKGKYVNPADVAALD